MRLFALWTVFSFCAVFGGERLKSDVSSPSAILINAETGAILYEKNAHVPSFPASTTKIATALYALAKKGDCLDQVISATHEAVAAVSPAARRTKKHPPHRLEFGGSHMGLKVGEELTLHTLLYGLMVASANDAANLIGEYVSGSVPKFMEEVNLYLKRIGCNETLFFTPHGLPHSEHKTTAYDLARMTQVAMRHPVFREIVRTVRYTKKESNKQPETVLVQTNALLKPGPHHYPKAIGVKTGYTVSAGHNLVAAAEDGSRSLIAVIMGCSDVHTRYQEAIALFEAAFREKKMTRTVFAKGYDRFSIDVKGAKTLLEATLHEDLQLAYYPSEEPQFKTETHWNKIKLPVRQGEQVGEVRLITEKGHLLKTAPLLAKADVTWSLAARVQAFFRNKVVIVLGVLGFFSFLIWRTVKSSKKRKEVA